MRDRSSLHLLPASAGDAAEQGFDWRRIRLVAFDVDGTLYDQKPLRLRMAARLGLHCLAGASLRSAGVLKTYRRLREDMAEAETEDFEHALVGAVARRHGVAPGIVRTLASEWMEIRPLSALAACRFPHVDTLFERIRTSGRDIGVLSDYPAKDKLGALSLRAHHMVCAREVGVLKPHPRGLQRLMAMAGATPAQTVLIGDRIERDGEAARRAGAYSLIRSRKPLKGARCFTRYDDRIFAGLDEPPDGASLPPMAANCN